MNSKKLLQALALLALTSATLTPLAWAYNPQADARFDAGMKAYQSGQLSQALLSFQDAVQIDPSNMNAWYNLGSVQYQLRAFPSAADAFTRVLQARPDDVQARYMLGLSQGQLARYNDAIATLSQIPATAPIYAQAQAEVRQYQAKASDFNPLASASSVNRDYPQSRPTNMPQKTTQQVASRWTPFNRGTPARPASTSASSVAATPTITEVKSVKVPVETIIKGLYGPTGMAVAPDGTLFVANYSKNRIDKILPNGQRSVLIEGKGLSGPVGLIRHPLTGDLIVANYLGNNLMRLTPSGQLSELAAGLKKPYYLTLDSGAMAVFVSEQGSNTVSKVMLPR
ncbi:MAG: tetratricopeptide repeat protein [Vampirovibrionales bacterium]|nr:tetratricopeptide repeat protein [Vampirovibrionales bacterium]